MFGFLGRDHLDVVAASFTINVLTLALPIVILQTYDRIIPNDSRHTLLLLVVGIVLVVVLDAILRIARAYVVGWAGARYQHRASLEAVERILFCNLVAYERDEPGVHLERLQALDALRDFYTGQAALIVVDLPFVVLFLGLIAYVAGTLVFVPLALLAVFALAAAIVGRRLHAALKTRRALDDRRYNFIIEVLAGIHTVKGLGMEELMMRRYERLQEGCAPTGEAVNLRSGTGQTLGALFGYLTMATVAGTGSLFVIDGDLTMGGLAACTLLAGRSLQPLMRAMGIWAQFQNIRVAKAQFSKIRDLPTEVVEPLPPLPAVTGSIEMKGVWARFEDDGPWLFEDLNLDVSAGEMVGICGGNGSGKSSLLWLIIGLLRPQRGQILIDGRDLSRFDPQSIRAQVAYVPQRAELLKGTILENLTGFRVAEQSASAVRLAEALGLDVITARMPEGYQTEIGGSAMDTVPGGIMQRIAIGRALVGDPPVILFDDAISFLDADGDMQVRELLAGLKGKRTVLLVCQRPSLLTLCDRIYDLGDGCLRERPRMAAPTDNQVVTKHFPL
ncbi:MAG: ABC transporter transmembrane domain-containing protein [Alphaproteobacteria bacterium]|nr:ABC transporter transmembrane domain-containing protein [Alphaproteobacteria bacterium]